MLNKKLYSGLKLEITISCFCSLSGISDSRQLPHLNTLLATSKQPSCSLTFHNWPIVQYFSPPHSPKDIIASTATTPSNTLYFHCFKGKNGLLCYWDEEVRWGVWRKLNETGILHILNVYGKESHSSGKKVNDLIEVGHTRMFQCFKKLD